MYLKVGQGLRVLQGRPNKFDLHKFWLDNKFSLPLHYAVYIAEVGCKKVAAANVESVFSGAGKFTLEAKSTGPVYLRQGAQQLEIPVLAAHRGGDHRALHAEARQHLRPLGCTALHLSSPDPSSSDAAASAAPSSGSASPSTSGHAADPPSADPLGGADMSLLQRAGVLQNTPYDA